MKTMMVAAIFLIIAGLPMKAAAQRRSRSSTGRTSATMRKRLHVNDLITEPGTVEIDWGNLYSLTTANFTMPSALKYTPSGTSVIWGRTEYSVAFDSVSSAVDTGLRTTRFSDRVSLNATSVVLDTMHFDVAIAPQATFFLRGASGARYGATVIAREDTGLNSMGATAGWSVATASSSTNPAGTWDFGGGFGRHLAAHGVLGQFTPHVNTIWERSTGFAGATSVFAGVEYQMTPRVAFDASGQRVGLGGGTPDREILLSMTVNLGKMR
jgi:hypothetical protein